MLEHLKSLLADGPQVESADEIGIICRTKGLLGGYGDHQIRPWASIAWMDLPN